MDDTYSKIYTCKAAITTSQERDRGKKKAWLACLCAALFMCYEFMQLNIINSLSGEISQTFTLTRTELGWFAASFFYANAIFLIPAGILLDRFSTSRLLLFASVSSVIGTAIIALSSNILEATAGRFVIGACNSFAFLSAMRLAAHWLANTHLARVTGSMITLGMLGGLCAQTPVTWLLQQISWRECLWISCFLGILITLGIGYFVNDISRTAKITCFQKSFSNLVSQLKQAIGNKYNWLAGIYTCLTNLPLALLAALWGNLYLTQGLNLPAIDASFFIVLLFFGMMLGSPLAGWLSDYLQKRKIPMVIGSLLLTLITLPLPFISIHSTFWFSMLFFFIGSCTSIQVLGYTYITENNPQFIASTAMSFSSVILLTLSAIFQPFFGWLITYHEAASQLSHPRLLDYQFALSILPISGLISVLVAMTFKEKVNV